MDITSTKVIMYGLRDKATGELIRIVAEPNESYTARDEFKYKLDVLGRDTAELPVFEVDSAEKAAYAMTVETPWYSSTREKPTWAWRRKPDLEVVEITHETTITTVEIEMPVVFEKIHLQERKPRIVLRRYLDFPSENQDTVFKMFVVALPAGETLETLQQKCRNKKVAVGKDSVYVEHAIGVFDLPEEYASYVPNGQSGIGLVTLEHSMHP